MQCQHKWILAICLILIAGFCKGIEASEVISAEHLLSIDEKYEELKRENTWETFQIAKKRLKEAPPVRMPFAHYVAVFDALSIAEAVRADWLSEEQRRRYLDWRREAESQLISILDEVESIEGAEEGFFMHDALSEARQLLQKALKQAYEEDLIAIRNAQPNGLIEDSIEKCREALRLLEGRDRGFGDASLADWDNVLRQVNNAIQKLKVRQQLKYSLWAERIFRATRRDQTAFETRLKENYMRLGRINLSLIVEPSLQKEITQLMYVIYERLEPESKVGVRYESIMQLETRKQLNEF